MVKRITLLGIILVVCLLAVSYRRALLRERGEMLIANAYYGNEIAVKDEVEQGAPLDFTLYFDDEEREYSRVRFNALHAAASGGNEDVINFLLEQRMDINALTPDGWTPLFIAARDGQAEAAKLLVYRGADLNLQTDLGSSALVMAVTQPYPSEEIRQNLLLYLLKRGADPNLTDQNGRTALYYAAVLNKLPVVELLLEYHAHMSAENRQQAIDFLQKNDVVNMQ